MHTDGHRFYRLDPGLASPSFGSLAGERLPAMEERGFEQSLSVFICVHLWLHSLVTAYHAGRRSTWVMDRTGDSGRSAGTGRSQYLDSLAEVGPRFGQKDDGLGCLQLGEEQAFPRAASLPPPVIHQLHRGARYPALSPIRRCR